MKNYLQHGDTLRLTAPSGGVTGGLFYKIGRLFGAACATAVEADPFELRVKGAFQNAPKATGAAWAEGDILYWDDSAKKFTTSIGTANIRVGAAVAAALDADETGSVLLIPSAGITVAALGTTVVTDNTKASIDTAIATLVAKINAIAAGVR